MLRQLDAMSAEEPLLQEQQQQEQQQEEQQVASPLMEAQAAAAGVADTADHGAAAVNSSGSGNDAASVAASLPSGAAVDSPPLSEAALVLRHMAEVQGSMADLNMTLARASRSAQALEVGAGDRVALCTHGFAQCLSVSCGVL
jgi:hypothetical protein